jgi:hypothetical protein
LSIALQLKWKRHTTPAISAKSKFTFEENVLKKPVNCVSFASSPRRTSTAHCFAVSACHSHLSNPQATKRQKGKKREKKQIIFPFVTSA